MENIVCPGVLYCAGQPQVRQHLVTASMDSSNSLEGRSIDNSHPGASRVDVVRPRLASRHLFLELLKVESGGRRFTTPDCATLAMGDFFVHVLAVDLVVNLIVVVRP